MKENEILPWCTQCIHNLEWKYCFKCIEESKDKDEPVRFENYISKENDDGK